MSFDFFPNEQALGQSKAASMPSLAPEPGFWTGFSKVPQMIAGTVVEGLEGLNVVGGISEYAKDAMFGGTGYTDRYLAANEMTFGTARDYWTPSPGSVGTAAQIVGSLVPMIGQFMVNPVLPLITTAFGSGTKFAREPDVSATQAWGAAMTQTAGLGLGIYLPPAVGSQLISRIASGAAINVAQGVATRAATQKVLEGTEAAKQFPPWQVDGMIIDALMGAAFGGLSREPLPKKPELTPTEKAALLVANQARHLEDTTAPGIPATPVDATVHVEAMKKAIDDVIAGRTTEVGQLIQDIRFLPDEAKIEFRKQLAEEVSLQSRIAIMDEMGRLQMKADAEATPGFLRTADELVALKSTEPDFAKQYAPELAAAITIAKKPGFLRTAEENITLDRFIYGRGSEILLKKIPEPKAPETVAPNKTESDFAARVKAKLTGQEAPAGKPKIQVETDPTVLEAQQRIAQYPDMTVEHVNADGSTRIVKLADELRALTEDVQRAQIEAPTLFQTAAACFLGAM